MNVFPKWLIVFTACLVMLGGVAGGIWLKHKIVGTVPGQSAPTRFALTDHDGQPVTEATYRGRALLVFFGFTRCPDVCPTSMIYASDLLKELGPRAEELKVLFVTVDPEFDTQPALKEYLAHFDPRITGLTGTSEQIAATAKTFGVYYAKRPLEGTGDYTMDHSTAFYFVAQDGRLQRAYSMQNGADKLTDELRAALDAQS